MVHDLLLLLAHPLQPLLTHPLQPLLVLVAQPLQQAEPQDPDGLQLFYNEPMPDSPDSRCRVVTRDEFAGKR